MGSDCSWGQGFLLGVMEMFRNQIGVTVAQHYECVRCQWITRLQMVETTRRGGGNASFLRFWKHSYCRLWWRCHSSVTTQRPTNCTVIHGMGEFHARELYLNKDVKKLFYHYGASGWLSLLSNRLLIWTQVIIRGSWDRAPSQALHWAWSLLKILFLSLPLLHLHTLSLSLSLI